MYEEPKSPKGGGMLNIYGEPGWSHEGVRLRYMVSRNRQMRGVLNMYDEPDAKRGARLTCMMSRYRQMRDMFSMYDEPESPHEGACLTYDVMNRYRQRTGHV